MEIERVLTDWEEKCADLEEREKSALAKMQKAKDAEWKSHQELSSLKKEARSLKAALEDATDELKLIQSKYEEKLDKKEVEKLEVMAKHNQVLDKAQFEVEFLKKELEN